MEAVKTVEAACWVLIADSDRETCAAFAQLLRRNGFAIELAHDPAATLELLVARPPQAMVLDYRMAGSGGAALLERIRQIDPTLPVIVTSAAPAVREAVAAIKLGAYEYLAKPLEHRKLLELLALALAERNSRAAAQPPSAVSTLCQLMGSSRKVQELAAEVGRVARTNFSVLILGETGAGKELVAHEIHHSSERARGPFVALDCGAIPEALFENELFGHERGAFTGATERRLGKLEAANRGTLFLDEISNMPLSVQAKFLRALQERTVHRLGGNDPIAIDIRIVAATNVDLEGRALAQLFRGDLFYRLDEFAVRVPPLRERKEDIAYLSRRFLGIANTELGKNLPGFSPEVCEMLVNYDWPGNVRELLHAVRRAALLADEAVAARHFELRHRAAGSSNGDGLHARGSSLSMKDILRRHLISVEREVLAEALRATAGNKAAAARLLKIDYKTIHSKVKEYGISLKLGGHQ